MSHTMPEIILFDLPVRLGKLLTLAYLMPTMVCVPSICSNAVLILSPTVPHFGLSDIVVDDETTSSLQVSWEIEDKDVEQFKVSYRSLRGGRGEESVSVCHIPSHRYSTTHSHTTHN